MDISNRRSCSLALRQACGADARGSLPKAWRALHGYGRPEPIGLEYIAAALTSSGCTVAMRSEVELETWLSRGTRRVSLISATTPEWPRAIETAAGAKRRGNLTVVGGYHATSVERHNLEDAPFDYIVRGEGEHVGVALGGALVNGRPVGECLEGLADFVAGKFITAGRLEDLDGLPFPMRSKRFLAGKLCDLMWPPPSRQRNFALVLASRGCVHACSFCASATMWGRGIRHRSPANVVAELRSLKEGFETNTVVFVDQSLGLEKEWTLDLCQAIKASRLGINWYPMCNMSIDRDVLRAMAEAGCTKIAFGVEGLSPHAVERLKPQNPHDFDVANELFGYCNSLGILVKAFLMIGMPWETSEIIDEYLQWLPRLRVNQIKPVYFTPFPGTADWERYKGQLATTNWEDFDTVRMPVVKNPEISVAAYRALRRDLFRCFYESDTFAEVTRQMVNRHPHYAEAFAEFILFLREHRIADVDPAKLRLSEATGRPATHGVKRQAAKEAVCS